jgi:Fe-S-cluster containining protein
MVNYDKCRECGGLCCKTFAVIIDKPECEEDYEHFKWYLYHTGTSVFMDKDGDWNVEVHLPCKHLGDASKCRIYDERPPICREYNELECDDGPDVKIEFKTPEEVDEYVKKLKAEGKL